MSARRGLAVSLALIAGLACATPSSDDKHEGSTAGPDELDGGGGSERPDQSCEATSVREVRYGGTVDQDVKLRPEIARLRCVEDAYTKLEADIACANEFNRASWEHAYHEAGLEILEAKSLMMGQALGPLELGSLTPHPDDPRQNLVYLGEPGYGGCSGTSLHTPTSPGVKLARNRAGEVVTVVPTPSGESRSYTSCTCFSGCGMMRGPEFIYAALDAEAKYAGVVELSYPAIAISTSDAESESCCCAP